MVELRKRIFARLLLSFENKNKQAYESMRKNILKNVKGNVLEIGAGTGINFEYYPKGISLTAVEPNQILAEKLKERGIKNKLDVKISDGNAEKLPFKDNKFDCVVCTLVLCSVRDVKKSLTKIKRVLKKGGKFIFIEHVADKNGTLRRSIQEFSRYTPWRLFSDKCNPARETSISIKNAGFKKVKIEEFMLSQKGIGFWLIKPHILGIAVK